MKKTILIVVTIVLAVCVVFGLMLAGTFNRFVRLEQGVNSQWAQVQNVYQRRADLIPNLMGTVAGAANFEKTTLMEITTARASVGQVQLNSGAAPSEEELIKFQKAQNQLSGALSRLMVVVERYPDLKANSNFLALQSQLEGSENRISVERGRYNEIVQSYNTAISTFPGVLFAGVFNHRPKAYFKATEGSEVAPKVQFDFSGKPAPAK